jgi:hypothetical protein
MRAITVRPGKGDSAQLKEVAEPPLSDGALLVRARALRVPLERWHDALERRPDDIKVVIEFA